MPRGKNTNVYMICQNVRKKKQDDGTMADDKCAMQNYKTRINKKTFKAIEQKKFCPKCNTHTAHKTGSEIKHSS